MMIKQNENEYLIKTNGMWTDIKRLFRPHYISDNEKFSLLKSEITDLKQQIRKREEKMSNLEATDGRIANVVAWLGDNLVVLKERVNRLEKQVK